jgi:hypothetical protein
VGSCEDLEQTPPPTAAAGHFPQILRISGTVATLLRLACIGFILSGIIGLKLTS